MDTVFPDIPLYQGWGAPLRLESDIRDLRLAHGQVPRDLTGVLYRCGPDRQYPSMAQEDVFIDGEGMAHLFRFENGHVDYRSRWVRTERFRLQEQARRSLFGRYRNRYTNDPGVAGKNMGTANTNIVWHGRKLLALKEDSLPIELDPETLATRGEWRYEGDVSAVSLTAHPKLDYHTNELLTFSYQARGDGTTDIVFYIAAEGGNIVHETWFNMPYPGMVHDFAVTDSHVIVPFFPLITDVDALKQGGPFYQWHPDKRSHFAILPRWGTSREVRWFQGPAVSAGHMMNAFNEGSQLHLDLCLYNGNCFDFFPSYDGSAFRGSPPQLTRLSFDLAGKHDGYEAKLLARMPTEMPKCDDRFMGKPYRYGYGICRSPTARPGEMGMGAIARFDHQTGAMTTWSPGENCGVHEPNLVVQPGAPEGEGYLLVIVNRLTENHSDLAILNASDIAAGPIALLTLPVRVRSTFHGMWVSENTLTTGRYVA